MAGETHITIVGNVTADPELRFSASGTAVANFSVAVNERKMNAETRKWEEGDSAFYNVRAFRQLAENIAESVTRGMRVIIHGKMTQDRWEDKDGTARNAWKIIADAAGPDLSFVSLAPETLRRSQRRQDVAPNDPWAAARPGRPADSDGRGQANAESTV